MTVHDGKRTVRTWWCGASAALGLLLSGCTALTTDVLVKDAGAPRAGVVAHCAGSEWMDNSMVAVVPIPVFAFASPTQEINEISADDVLRRCGPPEQLVNRHVEVDRGLCAPLAVTRVVSLGVWHWCPASVSWEADVTAPAPAAVGAPRPRGETGTEPAGPRSSG